MKCRFVQLFKWLLIMSGLGSTVAGLAQAGNVPQLSGSYELVQQADAGTHTRVRLLIQLANHGTRDLYIQRLTLWDLKHADPGATQTCSLIVHSGAVAGTEQEFTIPRAEYELWTRGTRPRLVLQVRALNGSKTTEVVRLERIPRGRAN